MKMKTRFAALVILLGTSASAFSATELERLRALCAEQEMQIHLLEEKIARLTDSPPPARKSANDSTNPTPKASDAGLSPTAATYTVKPGDNIERIARNQKTTASILYKLNNLQPSSVIHPGQKIKLPSSAGSLAANPSPPSIEPNTPSLKHTIKTGETFYRIANTYGVTVSQLSTANPDINHNALKVGQVIVIPSSNKIAKTPQPEPTPSLTPASSVPVLNSPTPAPVPQPARAKQRLIKIEKEITYQDFAKSHNTTTARLDQLNALQLDPATVLARGSELYVPAQP